MDDFSLKVKLL